jgi:hypothetical protein
MLFDSDSADFGANLTRAAAARKWHMVIGNRSTFRRVSY